MYHTYGEKIDKHELLSIEKNLRKRPLVLWINKKDR